MSKITKAVFPVAGLGTRFLPATKASPKEMLPVVDKPLIQYAVEEAIAAGITELIFVTGRGKRSIEDHFDKAYELEVALQAAGKLKLLRQVRHLLPSDVHCVYVRQAEARGLGHAVLCAKQLIGDQPFAVLLADDLIDGEPPVLQQMVEQFAETQCSILGVQHVARKETTQYGIIQSGATKGRLHEVSGIVEKPRPENAPSDLGVVGRYVLTPRIFHHLAATEAGAGKEIQLTDAIDTLRREERVLAYEFDGKRYDCGSKLGYLKATVAYALKHEEVGHEFRAYLQWISSQQIKPGERRR
ncbi:MAG: UTP--glucose-1-phosphate uridylyltransferase GalU [Burkholderiales bacterium]|nr:UTP--glucose-1-phosphate uridylyltransferase GalU [Burkholderiales bacterium]